MKQQLLRVVKEG